MGRTVLLLGPWRVGDYIATGFSSACASHARCLPAHFFQPWWTLIVLLSRKAKVVVVVVLMR